jgi:arginine decarboxylase
VPQGDQAADGAAGQEPVRHVPADVNAEEPARELPRRARVQGSGAEQLFNARAPVARAARAVPRTCSGRFATRSCTWCAAEADIPEELEGLEKALSDTYFCNFSIFQSLPDAWAIDQLFPVCPIHRLNEEPTHARDPGRHHLRLRRQDRLVHRPARRQARARAAPPRTTARTTTWACSWSARTRRSWATCTTCSATPTRRARAAAARRRLRRQGRGGRRHGQRGAGFVDYSPSDLLGRLRANVEVALRKKLLTIEESRQLINRFRQGMIGYTYLDKE